MTTLDIREKLYDYIRFADEKKVKAFYTIIENEIKEEYKWWNDKEYMSELGKRSADYKSGITKGFTWEETKIRIQKSPAVKLK